MDHPGLFTAGGETAAPAEFLAAIQKVLEVRSGLARGVTRVQCRVQRVSACTVSGHGTSLGCGANVACRQ